MQDVIGIGEFHLNVPMWLKRTTGKNIASSCFKRGSLPVAMWIEAGSRSGSRALAKSKQGSPIPIAIQTIGKKPS